MACRFGHIKDVFEQTRIEVMRANKKQLDDAMHAAAGGAYKDYPAAWRAVKAMLAEPGGRGKIVAAVRKAETVVGMTAGESA